MRPNIFFLSLILITCFCGLARGRESNDEKLALLLARTCVAEIGFEGEVDECMLMWSINQKNAIKKGRSLKRQTLLFNAYWKSKIQRRRRPWIKYLDYSLPPKYWPKTMSWAMFEDRWFDIWNAAEIFVHSNRQFFHGCPEAMDYGAPGETPNMRGVEKVKCIEGVKTRQRYWRFKK